MILRCVFTILTFIYFINCSGNSNKDKISEKDEFNNMLEFKTKLIPYKGNDSWVEPTLYDLKDTLM